MAEELAVQRVSEGVMSIEQSRAIQEVQASLVIAKKFPRDQDAAYLRIMKACERYSLADQAEYAYPRGDKTVTGPTIRIAETLAQNWGNLNFGIRELSQSKGGFLRRRMHTLTTESMSGEMEPQKKSLFGSGKKKDM